MKQLGMLLAGAGGVLAVIGLFWGVVIGFYPSEVPALLATLGSGALLLFIGSKMLASTKPTSVEWRPVEQTSSSPTLNGSDQPLVAESLPIASQQAADSQAEFAPVVPHETSTADQVNDSTVAVPRRRRPAQWSIELPVGTTALIRNLALLGRAPALSTETPEADLIVISDSSVSKTHALLKVINGELQVLDLDSANGTVIVNGDIEYSCAPGMWVPIPHGATLELGTAELRCSQVIKREVAP